LKSMVRNMNLKKHIRNRKGSYIVEAALTLPVFVVCVTALALIVNIIAICENICFAAAEELHEISLASYWEQTETVIPVYDFILEEKIYEENPRLTQFKVTNLDYMYYDGNIDDLIGISTRADFTAEHPLGINGRIRFEQELTARGFTGTRQSGRPLTEAEFQQSGISRTVVVFPKFGIRYHIPECRYVRQEYEGEECRLEMEAEDAERKGYTPCQICGGLNNE